MFMKIAIMQPYIFPYIGYFQLINAVDVFVFYDDVNYIKGGWINRNKILVNNRKNLFTIPLKGSSSFQTIKETSIHPQLYGRWGKKFIKSLEQSYSKAPYFKETINLIKRVLNIPTDSISELCILSIVEVANYLSLKTEFKKSSELYTDSKGLDKVDRILNICYKNNSNVYINPSGGKELYQKETFKKEGIELLFIENELTPYPQFNNEFIPGLSMIDVLMFNSKEEIKKMLTEYTLV